MNVTLGFPSGRPIQLKYTCPMTGVRVRKSTGTYSQNQAEEQRKLLEAKLTLGLDVTDVRVDAPVIGPHTPWEEFAAIYKKRHIDGLRKNARRSANSCLRIAARIVRPKTLGDMADRNRLIKLREQLEKGAGHDQKKPRKSRSKHTVKSHMTAVISSLNWAEAEGYLPAVPKLPKYRTSKLKAMKGRAITVEEYERVLDAVEPEVGEERAESWKHLLRGLWASAFRIGEIMSLSWDDPNFIRPEYSGRFSVLVIPAALQKNDTEEEIPVLPWFAAVLNETPENERSGFIFNPIGLRSSRRLSEEWCGKVIRKFGKRAKVVVEPPKNGKKAKFASAHDLRRSCAERMIDAEVPENILTRVLRHESIETTRRHYSRGTVQREAAVLHEIMQPNVTEGVSTHSEEPVDVS